MPTLIIIYQILVLSLLDLVYSLTIGISKTVAAAISIENHAQAIRKATLISRQNPGFGCKPRADADTLCSADASPSRVIAAPVATEYL